jgi:large subunit ribosomal protein L22
MEVIAHARKLQIAPRKVRLVAGLVRGLDVAVADAQLRFLSKAAATPVRKLIASAIANATHNFKLSADRLFIKRITVDGGPVLKRMRPRAMGSGAAILKRSSHLTVVLDERAAVAGTPKVGLKTAKVRAAKKSATPAAA